MPDAITYLLLVALAVLAVGLFLRWRRLHVAIRDKAQIEQALRVVSDIPPIPIDPENPPKTMYYRPKGEPTARCSCHNRLLVFNEEVLFWPQPDGAVLLFCHGFTPERPIG